MIARRPFVCALVTLTLVSTTNLDSQFIDWTAEVTGPRIAHASLAQPIEFIENRGQWDRINLVAHQGPLTVALARGTLAFRLSQERASVSLNFEGASTATTIAGEGKRPTHYNFYMGDADSDRWR